MSKSFLIPDDEVFLKEPEPTVKIVEPPKETKAVSFAYKPQGAIADYSKLPDYLARKKENPRHSPWGINGFVIGGGYSEKRMLQNRIGFNVTTLKSMADLFIFTGGDDINPALYNEEPHRTVDFNDERDRFEIKEYGELPYDVLKLGICRGGQLLNVLNGGSLFQHTDNHHGSHLIKDLKTGGLFMSNSIHHQQMIPGPGAVILAVANMSSFKINASGEYLREKHHFHEWTDNEIIWYPKTHCLCVQGHPEYENAPVAFKNYVFDLIETYYWELYGEVNSRPITEQKHLPSVG